MIRAGAAAAFLRSRWPRRWGKRESCLDFELSAQGLAGTLDVTTVLVFERDTLLIQDTSLLDAFSRLMHVRWECERRSRRRHVDQHRPHLA
jgi:hypothetical protein